MEKVSKILTLFFFVSLHSSVFAAKEFRVLSNSSLLGEGSLGELVSSEWKKLHKDVELKLDSVKDYGGLVGRLKREKGRGKIDFVWGLSQEQLDQAVELDLVTEAQLFDYAPYSLIYDSKKIKGDLPKTWKELIADKRFQKNVLVQDPRLSGPGIGWLMVLFRQDFLKAKEVNQLVAKVFPSWSAAFAAFGKGEGVAVWSFQTSEAYYRCEENQKNPRYRVLPLKEGYPVHREFIARVKTKDSKETQFAKSFEEIILSQRVQSKIPTKNWMFPALDKVSLPSCYEKLTPVVFWNHSDKLKRGKINSWIDRWTLL